jgi:hypothetical protein
MAAPLLSVVCRSLLIDIALWTEISLHRSQGSICYLRAANLSRVRRSVAAIYRSVAAI